MAEQRRRVTLADVAAAAGVSPTTASLVLNQRGNFPPATRQRVHEIAEQLRYSPNVRALKLRDSRSRSIALVTALPPALLHDRSRLSFFLDLALTTALEALDRDHALTLVPPMTDLSLLDALDVDGAVVVDPAPSDPIVAALRRRHLPVVTIGATEDVDAVSMIDRGLSGVESLVDHLREQGAEHVMLVETEVRTALFQRLPTYLAERAEREGFRFSRARLPLDCSEAALAETFQGLLVGDDAPDAVYSPFDFLAAQAMTTALAAGVDVPGRTMFATNFDAPRLRHLQPGLTAMDLHLAEHARLAVDLVLRHLNGEAVPAVVPAPTPDLIVRESTRRH